MIKTLPVLVSLFFFSVTHSQQNILDFKKGSKPIARFWKGHFISFQLKNREWRKGELTRIQNDSFYIRPMIVQYSLMGADTFHFPVIGFALSDVYAMPKKGYLVDYINGRYQISRTGGHVHFYWIKSGWLFRVGAAGYAVLNVTNGLINNDLALKGSLGIAAGVFLCGVLLKHIYKPTLRIRNKYHLQIVKLSL